ncbi:MAG TPA: rhodanese-like domain-containing protein [Terriglobales bacterium]|nr:rhodanese-like domain-containing protein [Terriglobales bacterium]
MDFEITPEELQDKLRAGDRPVLLDVREPWEYEAARIGGSTHIPMDQIPNRVHQELDPDQHIVVICHHGVRSANVANWMRQQGFDKAQSLRGGLDRWSRQIDPAVPTY